MTPPPARSAEADARGASRSSLYLSATLYCDGSSSPVKIRNLSASGALVEGATSASLGSLVQMVRGALIVHALIAWSNNGKCGLKFSGLIDVAEWRAAPVNAEQQRVDEIVRLVKAGAVPLPVRQAVPPGSPARGDESSIALLDHVRRAAGLLDSVGDVLTGDPDIVTRHALALQNLDIAMQVIAEMEAILAGKDHSSIDAMH